MARRPEFDSDEQAAIVEKIKSSIRDDLFDRDAFYHARAEAFQDLFRPPRAGGIVDEDGNSDIHPPIVAKFVRSIHPRIVNSLLQAEPLARAAAVDPRNWEDAEARESWLDYRLKNQTPGFRKNVTSWLMDGVTTGDAVIFPRYEVTREMVPEFLVVENFIELPDGSVSAKLNEQVLLEVFPEFLSSKALGGGVYRVKYVEDGRHEEAKVTLDRKDPDVREDELSVLVEKEVTKRTLKVTSEPVENFVLPATARGYQKEDSEHMHRLFWASADEIEHNTFFRNITEEDLEKLRMMQGGPSDVEDATDELQEVWDELQEVDTLWGLTGFKRTKFRCVETYMSWRVNGKLVDMIFWVIPALGKLMNWEYHKVIYSHGRRPVVDYLFIPLTARAHGVGVWHLVHEFEEEIKVLIDQMNDRENLVNEPTLMVEDRAGILPQDVPLKGGRISVRNLERIAPLTWAVNPHGGFPVLQLLQAMSEQSVGISDTGVGLQPTRPNAPRTATGTRAMIAEAGVVLNMHIMLAHEAFRELLHQIDELDGQYLPEEVRFSVTGKPEDARSISRNQFQSRVRFILSGDTANTNPQIQQQVMEVVYQALAPNPLFTGQFIEMPEIAIRATHKLATDFIRLHFPGRDPSSYLASADEYVQFAEQIQQSQAQGAQEGEELELADRAAQAEEREREADRKDLDSASRAFSLAAQGGGNRGGE